MTALRPAVAAATAFALAVGLGLAACDGLFVEPAPAGSADLAISFTMSSAAAGDAQAFDQVDAVRIQLLRRRDGGTVFNQVVSLAATGTDREVTIELELTEDPETFDLGVRLTGSGQLLFQGAAAVTARRGETTEVEVPLQAAVASIQLAQQTATLTAIGQTVQLHAAALFATGDTASTVAIAWSSANPAVVSVTPTGLATAEAEGQAQVSASFETVTVSMLVRVQAEVATVEVAPAADTLIVGEEVQLTPIARDANGNALTRTAQWSSSATSVASVDASGRVRALSTGRTVITATVEGISGSALIDVVLDPVETVTVIPGIANIQVGATVQLRAELRTASGKIVTRPVQWSTSNIAVATVSPTGLVEGVGAGVAIISALSENAIGSARITVTAVVAAKPDLVPAGSLAPTPSTVAPGGTVTLSPWTVQNQGTAPAGSFENGIYISQDAEITRSDLRLGGTANPGGLAVGASHTWSSQTVTIPLGLPAGNFWIGILVDRTDAVSESDETNNYISVPFTVGTLTVASVVVMPPTATLDVGQLLTFTATAYTQSGVPIPGLSFVWASSNSAVATVDAGGSVTAVAPGTATITATAGGETGSAIVTVTQLSVPTVSIVSITRSGTSTPVPPNNIDGMIDITIQLNVPVGASVAVLEAYVSNSSVCNFSNPGTGSYVCSVNTAAFTGTPGVHAQATVAYPNGPGYQISAEARDPGGATTAQTQLSNLTFNNISFISAVQNAPTNCTNGTPLAGSTFWCEGDITADFLPVVFSANANDVVNSITLTASTGATRTDAAAPWSSTLQKAAAPSASSVADVEGVVGLTVTSTTVGGQTGPTCINPDPVLNPIGSCAVNTWVPGTGGLPAPVFLVDNRAPTITLFDITPATICPGSAALACYVNGAFLFSIRPGFFSYVEGGVGSPSVGFAAGLPGSEISVTSGADLAESATAQTYVVRATTQDKLGNNRTRWAGMVATAPTSSATSSSTQKFGVDKTNPTHVWIGVANGSINQLPAPASVTYTDTGVGPSGFLANPVRVRIQRISAQWGTECLHPDTGATISCSTNSGYVADDGVFTFLSAGPIPDGYYRISTFVIDQANNASVTQVIEVLNDGTAPGFGAGIEAPATIAGGSAVTFVGTEPVFDDVDLGSLLPYISYGPGAGFLAWPQQVIGTFGPQTLTGTDPASVTIGAFIRSVQTNSGTGLPSGTIYPATSVTYEVRDMAGHQLRYVVEPWSAAPNDGMCPPASFPNPGSFTQNCATRQLDITANVAAPLGGIFPDAYNAGAVVTNCQVPLSNCDLVGLNGANDQHGVFVLQPPSNATICNDASGSNCPTLGNNATMTTLTVTLTGPVSVFTSPFSEVQFRYALPFRPHMYIGSAGAPSITDNTVTGTRTITWTIVWNAESPKVRPAGPGTPYTVYAIGRNATGDALMSTTATVTVEGN